MGGEPPCFANLLDAEGRMPERRIRVRRAHDPVDIRDGRRVLVDAVWPRGLRRDDLHLDSWMRELAPSPALRRWYGHRPERWPEFRERYRRELGEPDRDRWLDELWRLAREGSVTLLFGARDRERNQAQVLREALEERWA